MPIRSPAAVLLALALLLSSCDRSDAPTTGPAAAPDPTAVEADLQRLAAAEAAGQPEAALIYAREIVRKYPGSDAATRVGEQIPALQAAADADRERKRLAGLWTYHAVAAGDGTQLTAYIFGDAAAEPDAPALRLVLRLHPEWGRNSYLLVGDGAEFTCTGACRLELSFDDGPARPVEASRAEDADPPAVFIEDDRMMFEQVERVRLLRIAVPLVDGRTIDYRFELGGYDPGRMQRGEPTDTR